MVPWHSIQLLDSLDSSLDYNVGYSGIQQESLRNGEMGEGFNNSRHFNGNSSTSPSINQQLQSEYTQPHQTFFNAVATNAVATQYPFQPQESLTARSLGDQNLQNHVSPMPRNENLQYYPQSIEDLESNQLDLSNLEGYESLPNGTASNNWENELVPDLLLDSYDMFPQQIAQRWLDAVEFDMSNPSHRGSSDGSNARPTPQISDESTPFSQTSYELVSPSSSKSEGVVAVSSVRTSPDVAQSVAVIAALQGPCSKVWTLVSLF